MAEFNPDIICVRHNGIYVARAIGLLPAEQWYIFQDDAEQELDTYVMRDDENPPHYSSVSILMDELIDQEMGHEIIELSDMLEQAEGYKYLPFTFDATGNSKGHAAENLIIAMAECSFVHVELNEFVRRLHLDDMLIVTEGILEENALRRNQDLLKYVDAQACGRQMVFAVLQMLYGRGEPA